MQIAIALTVPPLNKVHFLSDKMHEINPFSAYLGTFGSFLVRTRFKTYISSGSLFVVPALFGSESDGTSEKTGAMVFPAVWFKKNIVQS